MSTEFFDLVFDFSPDVIELVERRLKGEERVAFTRAYNQKQACLCGRGQCQSGWGAMFVSPTCVLGSNDRKRLKTLAAMYTSGELCDGQPVQYSTATGNYYRRCDPEREFETGPVAETPPGLPTTLTAFTPAPMVVPGLTFPAKQIAPSAPIAPATFSTLPIMSPPPQYAPPQQYAPPEIPNSLYSGFPGASNLPSVNGFAAKVGEDVRKVVGFGSLPKSAASNKLLHLNMPGLRR